MRRSFPFVVALAAVLAGAGAGCASTEEAAKIEAALAESGPWDIDDVVVAFGDTQYVPYTGAGPWVGPSGCTGGLTRGAGILRDYLGASFPQVSTIGGYSCRSINGDSTTMSVHATGRALDVMIPTISGEADNTQGDPIGHWLIRHAEEIGIQYIIWDRWTWMAARTPGSKERLYGGAHPHHDHLHVELSLDGGRAATPWFSGPMEPPAASDCPALASSGGAISETGPCFSAYGPATYWRHESVGRGGSMLWTNAFQSSSPSNWARWHIELERGGDYGVEVYVQQPYGVFARTRYAVRHDGTTHDVTVNLGAAPTGWLRLGVYRFSGMGGEHLSVYDDSATAVAPDQHIPADAIRLVRIEPAPAPAPTPTPTPTPTPEPTPGPTPALSPSYAYSPDPAVLAIIEVAEIEGTPIEPVDGGDGSLDDDPLVTGGRDRSLRGGCAVSAAGSDGPGWPGLGLGLVALAVLARRRRAPRRNGPAAPR